MKRHVTALMCTVVFILLLMLSVTAGTEIENNNTYDTATAIEVNNAYAGAIRSTDDIDWYKFTVAEDGYFSINFDHAVLSDSSVYWKISLHDSTGESGIDGSTDLFQVSGNSNLKSNCFGVSAGTYYIKISANRFAFSDAEYSIKVNFTAASFWETEKNNSKDNADIIDVNRPYGGSLSTKGDVDWYKFTVDYRCEVAVRFNHNSIGMKDNYWIVSLYDESGVKIILALDCAGDMATSVSGYKTLASGTYYVKIVNDYYSGVNYTFTVQEKHDCQGSYSIVTPPECTISGAKEKYCEICGKFIDRQTVPAVGHSYSDWITETEATCSTNGKLYRECGACGSRIYKTVDKTEHTYRDWKVKQPATCHSTGTRIRECIGCDHYESESINVLAHEFGDWGFAENPTCHRSGTENRRCILCGDVESRVAEQLAHKFGEWKTVSGSVIIPPIIKERTCELCGDAERISDWQFVWVTVLAAVAVFGLCYGIIKYINVFGNP